MNRLSPIPMRRKMIRELLRDAVNEAIGAGRATHRKMVASGAISNGALGRLHNLNGVGENVGIDTLDLLADHLNLEPWQLLHPRSHGTAIPTATDRANDIARAFDDLKDP